MLSEPNYNTTKFFTKYLLAIEMKKIQIITNKPVHLGLSILDLIKTVMHECWCDYIKPKYGENAKLCYIDRQPDSFITHIKTDDIWKNIAGDVKTKFDTSNDETDRPLRKEKNKKSG